MDSEVGEKCYLGLMTVDALLKMALQFLMVNKILSMAEGWYYPEFVVLFSVFYGLFELGHLVAIFAQCYLFLQGINTAETLLVRRRFQILQAIVLFIAWVIPSLILECFPLAFLLLGGGGFKKTAQKSSRYHLFYAIEHLPRAGLQLFLQLVLGMFINEYQEPAETSLSLFSTKRGQLALDIGLLDNLAVCQLRINVCCCSCSRQVV